MPKRRVQLLQNFGHSGQTHPRHLITQCLSACNQTFCDPDP